MNKNVFIIGAVIVVVAIAGFMYIKNSQIGNSTMESQNMDTMVESSNSENLAPTNASGQASIKEFTVSGSNFSFDNPSITVNKGDRVKITFKNSEGMHNLTIDGLNVSTKTIQSGEQDAIEFTADKQGMFEFYCSVGNHRDQGMKGMLMVN